jgi:hypothetical protein
MLLGDPDGPPPGPTPDSTDLVFHVLEIFFTALFSCELVMNMAAFWLRPFLADPWSWFDMVRPQPRGRGTLTNPTKL